MTLEIAKLAIGREARVDADAPDRHSGWDGQVVDAVLNDRSEVVFLLDIPGVLGPRAYFPHELILFPKEAP